MSIKIRSSMVLLICFVVMVGSATAPCVAGQKASTSRSAPARRSKKARRVKRTGKPTAAPKAKKAKPREVKRFRIDVPCRAWVPKGKYPKVVLLCVHGLGLNSKSYEDFGNRMSSLDIATFAVDVRGFGTWMQLEGKQNVDFDSCIKDVKDALEVLHKAYPNVPVFLLGESMGGAIALRVASEYPELIKGLVSAVPSGDRFQQEKTERKVAFHMLTGADKPMDVGKSVVSRATHDPALAERWGNDPLNRLQLTPRELWQFQRFMNENHDSAKKIESIPVLIIQGFKDKLVKSKGTIEIFNALKTPDKMLVIVGDREHLIFEENQFTDEVVWVVLGWVKSHMSGKSQSGQ